MAWKRFPTEDENIDPFNAPDPVMPIDEPVREELDLDDGVARLSRRNVRKRFQDASRTPKRAYQPPVHHDTSSTSSHPAVAAPEGSSDPADPVAATSPIANEEPIHGGYDQASRSKVSDASDSPAPSPVGSSHRDTHTWHRTSQQAPAPGGVRVRRKGGCGRMVIILIFVMFAAPTIAGSSSFPAAHARATSSKPSSPTQTNTPTITTPQAPRMPTAILPRMLKTMPSYGRQPCLKQWSP